MSSKRERILEAICTKLATVSGISGRVYRSDPEGVNRDLVPCINVGWSAEQATPTTVPLMERTVFVTVAVVTRGDVPDQLADPIIVDAHQKLMADTTLGGLAIDMALQDAAFEFVSADQTAGRLTHTYSVMFRHSYGDLTT